MDKRHQLQLNDRQITHAGKQSVVYVMSRDQRVADNHALLAAQSLAIEHKLPLIVVFCFYPNVASRQRQHYAFMVEGLKLVEQQLHKRDIGFQLTTSLYDTLVELSPLAMYFDFNPLNGPRKLQKSIAAKLDVPCYVVDTHNIIPAWVASDKEEFAAHTFRRKVHKHLADWLHEPSQIIKHPFGASSTLADWSDIDKQISAMAGTDYDLHYEPGEAAALKHLEAFVGNGLANYANSRNDPALDGQSGLSPYLHFGQISALRVALAIMATIDSPPLLFEEARLASHEGEPTQKDSVNALLEELIVRKELADNFCFYAKSYTTLKGAKDWAVNTLADHQHDEREQAYSLDKLEAADTHDEAWNAAQKQMVKTGKMHGYMRMYWAKKILEWSKSPQQAIDFAIYLNDTYSLDGYDPNGYTGIMWSIAGVHDRPWTERPVFGKIRYMNYAGLKRKFDIKAYANKLK